ncbi:MAG: class I tRNA ligase family protein, partial [Cyclobacteriaceae bacterium]
FHQALEELEDHFSKFRISDALMAVYKLIWDDFCSWYLEMVKPAYGEPVDRKTYEATVGFFEYLMKILHPFMPFITEELYQALRDRSEKDSIMVSQWPKFSGYDKSLLNNAKLAFELITQVRNIRSSQGISPREPLELFVQTDHFDAYIPFANVVSKLANLSLFNPVEESMENATSFVLNGESFFIPMEGLIDVEKEAEDLKKELDYTRGFLKSVEGKLKNERFVNNAPEQVVENERRKKADAEAKITALESRLAELGKG